MKITENWLRTVPHSFEVHSNESACRKSGRLGLEQVDVMKGIYGNNFILQFMVDHYCENYLQREDGLNVNAINVGHGGRQCIIHYS